MANPNPWADFESYKNSLRHNTVAKLQTIILGWTEQCRVIMTKSGKKQDLIDRMIRTMNEWKDYNRVDSWLRGKAVIDQVRETGQYSHYAMPPDVNKDTYQARSYTSSYQIKQDTNSTYPVPGLAGPSHMRYDQYAPTRKAAPPASAPALPLKPNLRFKSSPFFRVDQPVSAIVECPESTSAMDRRSQSLSFTLTTEQVTKLQVLDSRYQLRLFCTSSSWHNHHGTSFRTEPPCPVEFPPTCEVRVNNIQLTANLKGLKKKPGTAPPPDLGKSVRLNNQMPNRVDMVYINSQQPIQPKKYYMIVYLVETTTVEQLVDKLKKGKYKSVEEIRLKMVQTTSLDDDIVAGPQKMSLKCPLSYTRVATPCRSIQCPHAQCFDAYNWFSMMEQTTTWICPVCDKVLNVEELIIDGYFDQILKDTPDSVEDVMVEADGEWHTSDNKHASAWWRTAHPFVNGMMSREVSPQKEKKETPQGSPRTASQEVISLTDSEDDEGLVKRELSPASSSFARSQSQSYPNGSGRSIQPAGKSNEAEVIDLTLESDDDEPPSPPSPPPPPPPEDRMTKRKNIETNLPNDVGTTWKRPRFNDTQPASPTSNVGGGSIPYSHYTNGSGPPIPPNVMNSHSPYGNPSSSSNGWTRLPPPSVPSSSYQPPPYRHPSSPIIPTLNSYPPNMSRSGPSHSPTPNQSSFYYRSQPTARK